MVCRSTFHCSNFYCSLFFGNDVCTGRNSTLSIVRLFSEMLKLISTYQEQKYSFKGKIISCDYYSLWNSKTSVALQIIWNEKEQRMWNIFYLYFSDCNNRAFESYFLNKNHVLTFHKCSFVYWRSFWKGKSFLSVTEQNR